MHVVRCCLVGTPRHAIGGQTAFGDTVAGEQFFLPNTRRRKDFGHDQNKAVEFSKTRQSFVLKKIHSFCFLKSDSDFAGCSLPAMPTKTMKQERFRKLEGLTFTWVGDGNNVLHDLMLGCAKLGERWRHPIYSTCFRQPDPLQYIIEHRAARTRKPYVGGRFEDFPSGPSAQGVKHVE